jgi:hypothetical protein
MRVSLRIQKLYFMVATGCCLVGAAVAIAWGVRPLTVMPKTAASSRRQLNDTHSSITSGRPEPTREDFAKLWQRPLRRPLYDPPPPKPVVRALPPLQVEVLGTIIEGQNSMAMVRSERGNVEYKRVGDTLGPTDSPASVLEIGSDAIVVERGEERVTLRVKSGELR